MDENKHLLCKLLQQIVPVSKPERNPPFQGNASIKTIEKENFKTISPLEEEMRTTRRVLILADSDNTFLAAQSFNRKIDWLKIRDYLADPEEGRELIEMVIYLGLPPAKERFEEQRKTKEKFAYWARRNGFLVVAKEGKAKGNDYENNIDVVMAMDSIELALEIKPDIVVLVTGDSDFGYLAQKLRRRGIRVEVASVEQSLGNELKNSANSVVDLIEVFDQFDQQKNSQDYHRIGSVNLFD